MNIKMRVKKVGSNDNEGWGEEFDSDTVRCLSKAPKGLTAMEYANLVVDYFNDTLNFGEHTREVVSAEEII